MSKLKGDFCQVCFFLKRHEKWLKSGRITLFSIEEPERTKWLEPRVKFALFMEPGPVHPPAMPISQKGGLPLRQTAVWEDYPSDRQLGGRTTPQTDSRVGRPPFKQTAGLEDHSSDRQQGGRTTPQTAEWEDHPSNSRVESRGGLKRKLLAPERKCHTALELGPCGYVC